MSWLWPAALAAPPAATFFVIDRVRRRRDSERAWERGVRSVLSDDPDAATVADLQAKADAITNQRNTMFKGETLRGLLLTTFAWSTIGRIAGIAAVVAFVAAGLMLVLTVLGAWHRHRVAKGTA